MYNENICLSLLNKTIKNLETMKNLDTQINVYTKKVGAGHYEVEVICEETNEIFKYIETDMQIIDALSEEDGMYGISQYEAMQHCINKATNGKY